MLSLPRIGVPVRGKQLFWVPSRDKCFASPNAELLAHSVHLEGLVAHTPEEASKRETSF